MVTCTVRIFFYKKQFGKMRFNTLFFFIVYGNVLPQTYHVRGKLLHPQRVPGILPACTR
jgi:hypothetical protein